MEEKRITLSEFQNQEKKDWKGLQKVLDEHYIQKAEALLKECPSISKDYARDYASRLILDGELLSTNGGTDTKAAEINDIHYQRRNLLDVAVLCVQAPTDDTCVDGKVQTLSENTESRKKQLSNYVQMHPQLQKPNPNIRIEEKNVYTYGETKTAVDSFQQEFGAMSVTVTFMFNGHGVEEGLKFNEEKTAPTPLDTFLEDIRTSVEKYRKSNTLNLPKKIQVIFAQCYSYCYTSPSDDDLVVYSFTDDNWSKTYVQGDMHLALEKHALSSAALYELPSIPSTTAEPPSTTVQQPSTSAQTEEDMDIEPVEEQSS